MITRPTVSLNACPRGDKLRFPTTRYSCDVRHPLPPNPPPPTRGDAAAADGSRSRYSHEAHRPTRVSQAGSFARVMMPRMRRARAVLSFWTPGTCRVYRALLSPAADENSRLVWQLPRQLLARWNILEYAIQAENSAFVCENFCAV